MTVLEENHHSFLIIEHDPMLYEDAKEMVEYVAQSLKQSSRELTILLYSPAIDPSPAEDDRDCLSDCDHLKAFMLQIIGFMLSLADLTFWSALSGPQRLRS